MLCCNNLSVSINAFSNTVVSWKSTHGRSTLQVCQRGGWALFHVYSTFYDERALCLDALKTNNLTNTTDNGSINSAKVESWRYITLWPCRYEHYLAHAMHRMTQSFLLQLCKALEAVLLKHHTKLAPRWPLNRVDFDTIQESGPKLGVGWGLFCELALFHKTTVCFLVVIMVIYISAINYRSWHYFNINGW